MPITKAQLIEGLIGYPDFSAATLNNSLRGNVQCLSNAFETKRIK